MEEAPENSNESPHSVQANGLICCHLTKFLLEDSSLLGCDTKYLGTTHPLHTHKLHDLLL